MLIHMCSNMWPTARSPFFLLLPPHSSFLPLRYLRKGVDAMLRRKIEAPGEEVTALGTSIIEALSRLLFSEKEVHDARMEEGKEEAGLGVGGGGGGGSGSGSGSVRDGDGDDDWSVGSTGGSGSSGGAGGSSQMQQLQERLARDRAERGGGGGGGSSGYGGSGGDQRSVRVDVAASRRVVEHALGGSRGESQGASHGGLQGSQGGSQRQQQQQQDPEMGTKGGGDEDDEGTWDGRSEYMLDTFTIGGSGHGRGSGRGSGSGSGRNGNSNSNSDSNSNGGSAGGGGTGGGRTGDSWSCSACTFLNSNPSGLCCEICGSVRA